MGTITGCEDLSASSLRAAEKPSVVYCSHILYSGKSASMQKCSMKAAKPSFSHSPSHQAMVTRLPNHWCASSCATTMATRCFCCGDAVASSTISAVSRYVTRPQFSIAPAANSVMHIMSSLGRGYGVLKKSS